MSVAANKRRSSWIQPSMVSNLLKVLIIAQSWLIPEGLNPLETPSTPTNQSLSQFNSKSTSFVVNGQEFSSSSDELTHLDGKADKLCFMITKTTEASIHHAGKFCFLLEFIFESNSYLHLKWVEAFK